MNQQPGKSAHGTVTKRHVFYLSGFDPRGPAFYHALYAKQAPKQAALAGAQIQVGPAKRNGKMITAWPVTATYDGQTTETTYEFLRWDDVMRTHMRKTSPPFLIRMIRTYWLYLTTGTLWRILKIGYPPFVAGMYPVMFMALMLLVALTSASLVSWVFVSLLGLPWWPCIAVYLALGAAMIWAALRLEQAVPYLWPVHVFNFAADQVAGRVEQFEERIDRFAERIADYIAGSTDDEVLVVGHSNGTSVAVSALARALRRDPGLGRHGPVVSLLTLGQSILLVSLLPKAESFRRELDELGRNESVSWIDITAPRDGACFAVTDPLSESGLPPQEQAGGPRPKLLSVAMTDLFSAETWRTTMQRHWQRIHFQYLMAYEKPTPYDYFAITAGPQTLSARFQAFRSKPPFAKFKLFGS